jgi:hypothetical protein
MRIRTLACLMPAVALAGGALSVPVTANSDARRADKAVEVLTAARKAIGDKKLASLKTLSVQAALQRNINNRQLTSEVEILLDLPDRYLRSDASTGPMGGGFTLGFIGDKPIQRSNNLAMGGGIVVRMAGPGGGIPGSNEKLTPEEREKADKAMVRAARTDLSRLMLGWFAMTHPALNTEYTYAGEAESPDGKAHVIDARDADGFSARVFIDQQTQLPLMVTYKAPQPRIVTRQAPRPAGSAAGQGGERRQMTEQERKKAREEAEKELQDLQREPPVLVDYTVYFEDWREVDGINFPHKIRRAMSGTTNEEWTIEKVKVNPKIDAKQFEG